MDFGTALIVIAGIGAFYSLRSQRLRRDGYSRADRHGASQQTEQLLASPSPRETELEQEVGDLRARIHVLERIATDGRGTRALADEIESLREK